MKRQYMKILIILPAVLMLCLTGCARRSAESPDDLPENVTYDEDEVVVEISDKSTAASELMTWEHPKFREGSKTYPDYLNATDIEIEDHTSDLESKETPDENGYFIRYHIKPMEEGSDTFCFCQRPHGGSMKTRGFYLTVTVAKENDSFIISDVKSENFEGYAPVY